MITEFSDERTASVFAHVLGRIPAEDRAVIEDCVLLATDNRERAAKHLGDVRAAASVSSTGILWIDSDAMKGNHWRALEAAIAHELAHAALRHHWTPAAMLGRIEGEYAADAKAVSWGYPSLVSYDSLNPQPVGGAIKTFGEIEF